MTIIRSSRVIKDCDVGIYFRVSTNHKEQIDSIPIEASELTKLASEHRKWFVADNSIGATSAKTDSYRHKFRRIISECESKSIDIIMQ